MEAFANTADLAAGWRELSASEKASAETLLLRASAHLAELLDKSGVAIDPFDEVQAINLTAVTCNMVRRSMGPGSSTLEGISSLSQTIGSTTASVQLAGGEGAFWLSKQDRDLLGIGRRSRYRSIRPCIRSSCGQDCYGR